MAGVDRNLKERSHRRRAGVWERNDWRECDTLWLGPAVGGGELGPGTIRTMSNTTTVLPLLSGSPPAEPRAWDAPCSGYAC
jgi:hypothetical protein